MDSMSLPGNKVSATHDMIRKKRKPRPRLQAECARRGQPVPQVRFPGKERRS
jgi:hypothetical protein